MQSIYTEQSYENSIIELFEQMGYDHICGYDVEHDYYSPLYEDILLDSITLTMDLSMVL
jgi:type I restriction enzyme R subunit